MELTIFSEIFKFNNHIFIIEIFKDENSKKHLRVLEINDKDKKIKNPLLNLNENSIQYGNDSDYKLIFLDKNNTKISMKIKKELTFILDKLKKGDYIIYIENKSIQKYILKIQIE